MKSVSGNGADNPLGTLWAFMSVRRRRHLYAAMSMMLLGALAELMTIGAVIPFLALIANPDDAARLPGLGMLIEFAGARAPGELIVAAALLLIGAAIFAAIMRMLLNWVSLRFILMLSHEIGREVYARMLRQPYSFYVMRNSSELLAGTEKVTTAIWSVLLPAMQAVTGGVISLAIVSLLFTVDPLTATAAALTMAVSYLALSLAVRRRLNQNSERLSYTSTARVKAIQEGLGGVRDILLEQSQEVFEEKYRRIDYVHRQAQVVTNFITQSPRYVVEAIGVVLLAVLSVYVSTKPGGIVAAIPVLGALALGAQRLLPLLQQVYFGWSSFAGNRQILADVAALLTAPVVTSEPRDRNAAIVPFCRELTFDKVSFEYQTGTYALRDVEIRIQKGSWVGFVGETGSGKSTLLDLVMGLLEPTSGMISIDDVPLSDDNRANWQAQIAHVPQTIYLADSSIAANIAFGEAEQDIDMERVRAAARMAHIDTFIDGLAEGYGTPAGERGVRLSGGQRQRIGIARALYKRASVLIFDEATSALDDVTEKAIMKSIGELHGEITLLMIAHRTSTLSRCDYIVRLEGGRITERGSYADLLEAGTGRAAASEQ